MIPADSPLDRLPPPPIIHQHIGRLYRELALLRRLLRLSQATRDERQRDWPASKEVGHDR